MLNNEVNMRTSAEVCSQIASYFAVVDNCIAVSDTNKQYTVNPQTSYSPSPPINRGSYTSVIISPNTHNTADLYNGFIRADLELSSITIDTALAAVKFKTATTNTALGSNLGKFHRVWFGFKDARDAVEKYEIVANGSTIYTQNYGCEESFLTGCCANETTKRADVYSKARHKDIWDYKSGARCGVVIDWPSDGATLKYEKKPIIHLKIDLRRFLPLSNIKYLPAFAGKIELRLYFSCAALLCCPVGLPKDLRKDPKTLSLLTLCPITNEFTPISENIVMWTNPDFISTRSEDTTKPGTYIYTESKLANGLASNYRKFTIDDYRVVECMSIIPCFGIESNVYNSLVQRYANPSHPLTFPTQTMSFYTTTKALTNDEDKATITITPRFVDSIFCLFPLHNGHRTYFKNPSFKSFQLNCGNYGNIPAKPFSTDGNKPEFLEYCQNAMNMNGEQSGFNKEVVASLCNVKKHKEDITGYYSDDRSSFFIGLSTETDGTYQQGLTSLSPINFELIVSQDKTKDDFASQVDTPPLLCLLYDSNISILVRANGMPPKVVIGNYDMTTPE